MNNLQVNPSTPEFSYHLLRNALNTFGKNLAQLAPSEYNKIVSKAQRSYELESLVLASSEAKGLVISDEQLEQSVKEVISRYENIDEFTQDLETNGLNQEVLRQSLYRELLFDSVLQRVASKSPDVSDMDMRLFYEMHRDRFEGEELRTARHILLTINPQFPENTRDAALARMELIMDRLGKRTNRFHDFAKKFSECPTAMEEGQLGDIKKGQLYPELDNVLFSMNENEISPIIESEMGFHILWCEKIKPGKRIPFSKAKSKILEVLIERRKRNCQKNWLASLQQVKDA